MTTLPGNPVVPRRAAVPDLDQLTGVRSGKGAFYQCEVAVFRGAQKGLEIGAGMIGNAHRPPPSAR